MRGICAITHLNLLMSCIISSCDICKAVFKFKYARYDGIGERQQTHLRVFPLEANGLHDELGWSVIEGEGELGGPVCYLLSCERGESRSDWRKFGSFRL